MQAEQPRSQKSNGPPPLCTAGGNQAEGRVFYNPDLRLAIAENPQCHLPLSNPALRIKKYADVCLRGTQHWNAIRDRTAHHRSPIDGQSRHGRTGETHHFCQRHRVQRQRFLQKRFSSARGWRREIVQTRHRNFRLEHVRFEFEQRIQVCGLERHKI
jgi:hypothetical protein